MSSQGGGRGGYAVSLRPISGKVAQEVAGTGLALTREIAGMVGGAEGKVSVKAQTHRWKGSKSRRPLRKVAATNEDFRSGLQRAGGVI